MKTYLVAALALALAVGTVPAMAKGGGGGGGGHGSAGNAPSSLGADANGGSTIIHHTITDTAGGDHTGNAVDGPIVAPVSSRCATVLNFPRNYSKARVDYCLEQRG